MYKLFYGSALTEPKLSKIAADCGREVSQAVISAGFGRWDYAGWLTEEEWVFVKIKYL